MEDAGHPPYTYTAPLIIQQKWPANSPDLNPIENVWRLLKYRVGKRFPKTDEEVRQYIEEEWGRLQVVGKQARNDIT
jgi:DDE superfamily endonuclease